ncbi:MAG: hypothetical protein MZU91_01995 [Desulfosudis oleivorans]|nr:hypothetical protein [Desulfosudis oleivorans]
MNKPPASIALDQLGIPHRVFRHEKPVTSFEEAASARNQRPEQIVRSILFQVRPGRVRDGAHGRTRPGGLEETASTGETVTSADGDRGGGVGSDWIQDRDGESVWGEEIRCGCC